MTESSPAAEGVAFSDPSYRAAVVDLLGVIAYGEIAAFERLAEDAKLAPDLADKVALATMASAELTNVNKLRDRLEELGADPFEARSEEHTSELQSLMRISYAVFCLKKKNITNTR